eukprot:TRINITY_DN36620_c0_g1_i1.p1 TRINITY_DN36620_c0_g1~~TRINITY_DN36620_c0_g1_i1.p1  ORF type:complete len:1124 (+),score=340.44 TRINITY_DN36620_c0_g1_i1:201-3572(+)
MAGLPFDPSVLLDFAGVWDANKVQMLDHVVTLMYSGDQNQRQVAHEVLTQLKNHPDSWRVVDTVLATSQSPDTKFFALNVLANVIATRWRVLPEDQRNGIKNYVVQLVIKISSDENFATTQRHFLTKLNETLVHIVKQEWPHSWENFISDICASSRGSQSLCENNLRILNLLSEEVFTFGKDHMVSSKVMKLKDSLNAQFATIYGLCDFIFKTHVNQPGSIKSTLLVTTLSTLSNFLVWIPLGYIFETDLIQTLLVHFWDPLEYRIECTRCLNEIACLHEGPVQQYQPQLIRCFQGVVEKIQQLPENMAQASAELPGSQRVFWETFHNQVALLLTGFMKHNMAAMEAQQAYMLHAIGYLVRIMMGPNEETFKICVEFWQTFSARIFLEMQQRRAALQQSNVPTTASPLLLDTTANNGAAAAQAAAAESMERLKRYQPVLTEVAHVLLSKMAKPPEVTIKENEEGHIVRAEEEDTDELALYKMMREALIYLTHLNSESMEQIMLQRLTQECLTDNTAGENWSPTRLNRLCWAIGSISGAMHEADEKRFLVFVIKDLLNLCEMKHGKENKAAVASNIMYVVGQYPRFLRAHWKFLQTVLFKLFQFMHETFPGVQEMAVDTFLKICQKCKRKLVIVHPNEQMSFVDDMTRHVAQDISDLEHLHICVYFEACGYMISASRAEDKERQISNLMEIFNQMWQNVLQRLNVSANALQEQQTLREISLILRVNERMASAIGAAYYRQLGRIYYDMLKLYKACSDFISQSCAQGGAQAMSHAVVRLMRNVKRDTLRLVQTFVDTSVPENASADAQAQAQAAAAGGGETPQRVAVQFVPPLLEPVLADYRSNLPQARDAEVLDLLATLATRLSDAISQEVAKIFEMVFECTLDMIKGDFQSFPDHRTKFYLLLKAINKHCFKALFNLSEAQLKLYVDSLIWALKHEQPQVADIGLQILSEFVERLLAGPPQVYVSFFNVYYYKILQDILAALTDTLHKAGFKLQQHILLQLINAADCGLLQESTVGGKQRVIEFLGELVGKSFPTLHRSQVEIFVLDCFNKCRQPAQFQQHLRDFLIQLKEWGGDEAALYEADRKEALTKAQQQDTQFRMQVPGLIPQYDPVRVSLEAEMDDI